MAMEPEKGEDLVWGILPRKVDVRGELLPGLASASSSAGSY